MIARDDLAGRGLLETLRWRFTNGDIFYWRFLVGSVGVTLALTYVQTAVVWGGGAQPWSLLAPLLAPFAIYFFVRGWAYAKPLPYLCGFVLLMVGGVLPFALIQPG
ncbi:MULTISPECIES: hypothetical protein [Nocardioides]|uniref:hypothetical protein n=1 Tax=Nocardioides TaxID=1839 RepID=UPI00032F3349|nr:MULTISPECIES: hypothetical protein [Nocardioides]EON24352.1 nitroreductase family protein [Nocardioides sp. CF8]